jgi:hypothetical protein
MNDIKKLIETLQDSIYGALGQFNPQITGTPTVTIAVKGTQITLTVVIKGTL